MYQELNDIYSKKDKEFHVLENELNVILEKEKYFQNLQINDEDSMISQFNEEN